MVAYDGTFSGNLKDGNGITAELLIKWNKIIGVEIDKILIGESKFEEAAIGLDTCER